MAEEIDIHKVKTKLPEILRRAEEGKSFTFMNQGRPVANLVPSRFCNTSETKAAIANILKAKKPQVSDSVLKEMKRAGRQ